MFFFFFYHDTATTEIYTLSLHDALPISPRPSRVEGPVFGTNDGLAGHGGPFLKRWCFRSHAARGLRAQVPDGLFGERPIAIVEEVVECILAIPRRIFPGPVRLEHVAFFPAETV